MATSIYCMTHDAVLAVTADPAEADKLALTAFQEEHADCGLAVVPPGLCGRVLRLAARWEAGDAANAAEHAWLLRRLLQDVS